MLIFNCFILVWVAVDLHPIPGILGLWQEHTLDMTPVHSRAPFTYLGEV